MTVRDNLKFGNPLATDEQIWEALEVACLAEDIRLLPQGLDTLMVKEDSLCPVVKNSAWQ